MAVIQPSLLDLGSPEIDSGFSGMQRTEIGEGAWVDHLPQWLKGHQEIHEHLCRTTRWCRQERQMYEKVVDVPRLIARLPDHGPGHHLITEMAEALTGHYDVIFDSIMLAWYRDGRDSVAWHGDKLNHRVEAYVATVSTGSPRCFRIRLLSGNTSLEFSLGWGDLLVMGGNCQQTCEHTVPKVLKADPRITIMFRRQYDLLL